MRMYAAEAHAEKQLKELEAKRAVLVGVSDSGDATLMNQVRALKRRVWVWVWVWLWVW